MKKLILLSFLINLFVTETFSQKVGLVLSGGGARALCHIGAIKALQENEIPIDYVAGTSMGALIGSLYSLGMTAEQMERMVLSDEFKEWSSGKVSEDYKFYYLRKAPDASWVTIRLSYDSTLHMRIPESVVKTAAIDFTLMELMSAGIAKAKYNFDSLLVPFRCVSADIKAKKQVIFSKGDLAQAVRASMSFPFYFPPLLTDNKVMFDGGIYNNFPVDVMQKDFSPDIVIGVNVSAPTELIYEDNVLSQVKTMLVQQQEFKMPHANDILIAPSILDFGTFDLDIAKAAIDSGYQTTMRMMDSIKATISRRISDEKMQQIRASFFDKQVIVKVDKIIVNGLSANQASYFRKVIKPEKQPVYLYMIKKNFFKLTQDDNVRLINPKLIYNEVTGFYDMHLEIKRNKELMVDFGGNFSSRPVNEGFVGLQRNWLNKVSWALHANTYFGKLYNSGHIDVRLDVPGKSPFFVQPEFTINRFDYFKSSSAFYEDVKPSYLVETDGHSGVQIGMPARNKAKIVADVSGFNEVYKYYQTHDFTTADTTDRTNFGGITYGLTFERNTLNHLMYANGGSLIGIYFRGVNGNEKTIPGSTSESRDTIEEKHSWQQLKIVWDNYFKKIGPVKLGLYSELQFSNQPFFANYTASILSAPGFSPTPESQTVFLENYHAYNYLGLGLRSVIKIIGNLDLRLEGYMFQPFNQILLSSDGITATLGDPLAKRYYIADANVVFHSPVGPVSLSFNYYDKFDKPFTIMFHLGYIIFNKRALQ